jgi:hypothetical protein
MGTSGEHPRTEPVARTGHGREPLEALAQALNAAGLQAAVRQEYPGAERRVHATVAGTPSEPLRISHNYLTSAGYPPWFFGPGYKPIGPAGDLEATVAAVTQIFIARSPLHSPRALPLTPTLLAPSSGAVVRATSSPETVSSPDPPRSVPGQTMSPWATGNIHPPQKGATDASRSDRRQMAQEHP